MYIIKDIDHNSLKKKEVEDILNNPRYELVAIDPYVTASSRYIFRKLSFWQRIKKYLLTKLL